MEIDTRYLQSLLEFPKESDKCDYKAAIKFEERSDFALKLVKHILGFGNSGGGHIVIGYKESNPKKTLSIDENLSDEIVSSYEVTRLCQYVDSILGSQDRIDLTITKVDFNGETFPMIYVLPFAKRPFFCKRDLKLSNGDIVLEDGTIYIRVPGAKTVKVAGAGDWDRLISQCVEAEYETFVRRAKDVFAKGSTQDSQTKDSNALSRFQEAKEEFNQK